jgi:hypothetical protein
MIHINVTYINGTGPTYLDENPSIGLCNRIIKSIIIEEEDIIDGNNDLDCLFLSIAEKEKKEKNIGEPILICLCIDDYNQLIQYSKNGRELLKQISFDIGNCLGIREDSKYILFPIFSGTIDLSIEKRPFTSSFYPNETIIIKLLDINDIKDIIIELSKNNKFSYLKNLLENRSFIRLVQSLGGHCRSIEFLIKCISESNKNISFEYDTIYQEVSKLITDLYNFKWITDSTNLIEIYILRETVKKLDKLNIANSETTIQELEELGIVFLSGHFEDLTQYIVDIPYIWLKLLYSYCKDNTVKMLLRNMFHILEHSICGRDFEKFNYNLLILKIYFQILKKKETFSIKDIYNGGYFIDKNFDLHFKTPNLIKSIELEHQYPRYIVKGKIFEKKITEIEIFLKNNGINFISILIEKNVIQIYHQNELDAIKCQDILNKIEYNKKKIEVKYKNQDEKIYYNIIYLNAYNASFADIFYHSQKLENNTLFTLNSIFEQEKYSLKNENVEKMIKEEYEKVYKYFQNNFAFIFISNGKVDNYGFINNSIIISEKEMNNYYGAAFSPRLTLNSEKLKIINASKTELIEIHGIGDSIADKIIEFRKNEKCTISNIQNHFSYNDKEMSQFEEYLIFEDEK